MGAAIYKVKGEEEGIMVELMEGGGGGGSVNKKVRFVGIKP